MSRYVVTATWDDVPHLSEATKRELWASIPPWQRDARAKGIPALGAGAIYPVPEEEIVIPDFAIPPHWPRAYGLDVGWRVTGAVWGAWDREANTGYIYAEHRRGEAEPTIHAAAIRGRGVWIPGVVDPAARGRAQKDGAQLLEVYKGLGLDLEPAQNAVEAGIYAVWTLLSAGRLKIFRSCQALLAEMRLYRRDENGRVVKDNDHLCDALRYWVLSGRDRMKVAPAPPVQKNEFVDSAGYAAGWMG